MSFHKSFLDGGGGSPVKVSHTYTLTNPNAEAGDYTTGWTLNAGSWQRGNGISPMHEGSWYWEVGSAASGSVYQDVAAVAGDMTAAIIDAGFAVLNVEFYAASYNGNDEGKMTVDFMDGSPGSLISSAGNVFMSPYGNSSTNVWVKRTFAADIPALTRNLRIYMWGNRRNGVACNNHMDGIVVATVGYE